MTSDASNPFAPPQHRSQLDTMSGSGTAFRTGPNTIAVSGAFRLPAICVLTGSRNELVEQSSRIRSAPKVVVLLPGIVFGILGPLAIVTPEILGFHIPSDIANLCFFSAVLYLAVLNKLLSRTSRLTWYVSSTALNAVRAKESFGRKVIILAAGGTVFFSLFANSSLVFEFLVAAVVVAILWLVPERILTAEGRSGEFVIVRGFQEAFFETMARKHFDEFDFLVRETTLSAEQSHSSRVSHRS